MIVMCISRAGHGGDKLGCQRGGEGTINHDCVGVEKSLRGDGGKGDLRGRHAEPIVKHRLRRRIARLIVIEDVRDKTRRLGAFFQIVQRCPSSSCAALPFAVTAVGIEAIAPARFFCPV